MKDILATITKYREGRGWTEYQLAEHSGLPQLFAEGDAIVSLTASQKKLLDRWTRLSEDQQNAVFLLIDKM